MSEVENKYDWHKQEKEYYAPKTEPSFVKISKFKFITIEGQGNPNTEDFAERIQALYLISYAIKMMPKGGFTPNGYFEYTVYPLEGLWYLLDHSKPFSKDNLKYKIMIKQPEFVTREVFNLAKEKALKKGNLNYLIL